MSQFIITKEFVSGVLAGITIQELSSLEWAVGTRVEKSAITPSSYVITACEKAGA
jgi:hypothetical protein